MGENKCWTERKRGNVIGWISVVSPIEGEIYYKKITNKSC